MFKENLKQIIGNLPLTMSESQDPQDVSQNRVMLWIEFVIIFLISPLVLTAISFFYPQQFDKLADLWKSGLVAFGTHFTVTVGKTIVKTITGK